jgi:DNA polymerase elongation subunit (family B)
MEFLKNINKDRTMLLNVIYHPVKKDRDNHDYLDIIYKDVPTGEKRLKTIEDPEMDIYFTKEEHANYTYNKAFLPLNETEKVRCKYRYLINTIAKHGGDQWVNFVKDCYNRRNGYEAKNVHKYPYVFGSDYDIENWYRIWYYINYKSDTPKPITKLYLDIEVDTKDYDGFPKNGECPINVITIVDEIEMTSYTFFLRNEHNPQIEEFENNIKNFKHELSDKFDEAYGKINYKFYVYDNEIELVKDVFKLINTVKRDFLLIWNLSFDIPYIIARLNMLGVDNPEEILCHNDFKVKEMYFYKDKKNFKIANKGDYFKISSYTIFLDQMIVYAGIRKGRSELRSHALSYVAQVEIQDEKLDYSEESDLVVLIYTNYKKFIMYNIKDVLLQLGIERKTQDVENIYLRAYATATGYNKIFKPTIFLKNKAYIEYYDDGCIIGNNVNVMYGTQDDLLNPDQDTDDDKFEGAIVGDPELNEHTGIKLFGKRSKYIYDNIADQDFASMYPSIIITYNVGPNTLIGKLIIDKDIANVYNDILNKPFDETNDKGKEFIDNYLIRNYGMMGNKWFNLPTINDLITDFNKEFNIKERYEVKLDKNDVSRYFIDEVKIGDE